MDQWRSDQSLKVRLADVAITIEASSLMYEPAVASTSTPTPTPTPAPAPLVELRGRKLIFRQEPLPIKYPKRREPRRDVTSGPA
jgi:hypothetical protein